MNLQEAIGILTIHQHWRLNADIPMIDPKELTKAIDIVIEDYYLNIKKSIRKKNNNGKAKA